MADAAGQRDAVGGVVATYGADDSNWPADMPGFEVREQITLGGDTIVYAIPLSAKMFTPAAAFFCDIETRDVTANLWTTVAQVFVHVLERCCLLAHTRVTEKHAKKARKKMTKQQRKASKQRKGRGKPAKKPKAKAGKKGKAKAAASRFGDEWDFLDGDSGSSPPVRNVELEGDGDDDMFGDDRWPDDEAEEAEEAEEGEEEEAEEEEDDDDDDDDGSQAEEAEEGGRAAKRKPKFVVPVSVAKCPIDFYVETLTDERGRTIEYRMYIVQKGHRMKIEEMLSDAVDSNDFKLNESGRYAKTCDPRAYAKRPVESFRPPEDLPVSEWYKRCYTPMHWRMLLAGIVGPHWNFTRYMDVFSIERATRATDPRVRSLQRFPGTYIQPELRGIHPVTLGGHGIRLYRIPECFWSQAGFWRKRLLDNDALAHSAQMDVRVLDMARAIDTASRQQQRREQEEQQRQMAEAEGMEGIDELLREAAEAADVLEAEQAHKAEADSKLLPHQIRCAADLGLAPPREATIGADLVRDLAAKCAKQQQVILDYHTLAAQNDRRVSADEVAARVAAETQEMYRAMCDTYEASDVSPYFDKFRRRVRESAIFTEGFEIKMSDYTLSPEANALLWMIDCFHSLGNIAFLPVLAANIFIACGNAFRRMLKDKYHIMLPGNKATGKSYMISRVFDALGEELRIAMDSSSTQGIGGGGGCDYDCYIFTDDADMGGGFKSDQEKMSRMRTLLTSGVIVRRACLMQEDRATGKKTRGTEHIDYRTTAQFVELTNLIISDLRNSFSMADSEKVAAQVSRYQLYDVRQYRSNLVSVNQSNARELSMDEEQKTRRRKFFEFTNFVNMVRAEYIHGITIGTFREPLMEVYDILSVRFMECLTAMQLAANDNRTFPRMREKCIQHVIFSAIIRSFFMPSGVNFGKPYKTSLLLNLRPVCEVSHCVYVFSEFFSEFWPADIALVVDKLRADADGNGKTISYDTLVALGSRNLHGRNRGDDSGGGGMRGAAHAPTFNPPRDEPAHDGRRNRGNPTDGSSSNQDQDGNHQEYDQQQPYSNQNQGHQPRHPQQQQQQQHQQAQHEEMRPCHYKVYHGIKSIAAMARHVEDLFTLDETRPSTAVISQCLHKLEKAMMQTREFVSGDSGKNAPTPLPFRRDTTARKALIFMADKGCMLVNIELMAGERSGCMFSKVMSQLGSLMLKDPMRCLTAMPVTRYPWLSQVYELPRSRENEPVMCMRNPNYISENTRIMQYGATPRKDLKIQEQAGYILVEMELDLMAWMKASVYFTGLPPSVPSEVTFNLPHVVRAGLLNIAKVRLKEHGINYVNRKFPDAEIRCLQKKENDAANHVPAHLRDDVDGVVNTLKLSDTLKSFWNADKLMECIQKQLEVLSLQGFEKLYTMQDDDSYTSIRPGSGDGGDDDERRAGPSRKQARRQERDDDDDNDAMEM